MISSKVRTNLFLFLIPSTIYSDAHEFQSRRIYIMTYEDFMGKYTGDFAHISQ
jgi:hypothetical protein